MAVRSQSVDAPSNRSLLWAALPGIIAATFIGGLAFAASKLQAAIVISPILLAIVLGAIWRVCFGLHPRLHPGVVFTQKRILRFAIVLLGLQLTATQLLEVGFSGVLVIIATVIATYFFMIWFGGLIGVKPALAELLAFGTSICGVSAIVAANTVTRAPREEVAYAIACITAFGTLAMLAAPPLALPFALDAHAFGFWTGSSIHEIAQVVAATFQNGEEAGHVGTVVKLARVMMLAPMVMVLGYSASFRRRTAKTNWEAPPVPWFVLGFLLLVGINSILAIPPEVTSWVALLTTALFTMALAAMGLETNLSKLFAEGLKPIALAAAGAIFISGVSFFLIKLTL